MEYVIIVVESNKNLFVMKNENQAFPYSKDIQPYEIK
jgi:hypothetical protein